MSPKQNILFKNFIIYRYIINIMLLLITHPTKTRRTRQVYGKHEQDSSPTLNEIENNEYLSLEVTSIGFREFNEHVNKFSEGIHKSLSKDKNIGINPDKTEDTITEIPPEENDSSELLSEEREITNYLGESTANQETVEFHKFLEELVSEKSYEINEEPPEEYLIDSEAMLLKSQESCSPLSQWARNKCEEQNKCKCVCSLRKVFQKYNQILKTYHHEPKILVDLLSNVNCMKYIPIGEEYNLSPKVKPRLISNKRKALVADGSAGPKEITSLTVNELLHHQDPQGVNFLVFPSSSVEIPCFIRNEKTLSANIADSVRYQWSHSNNRPITEGRIKDDSYHRGTLRISQASFTDTDEYTCKVEYRDPNMEKMIVSSFIHRVNVVRLPEFTFQMIVHYKAKTKCDEEVLEMFELYMPQQLEGKVCSVGRDKRLCHVEIYNPYCHTMNKKHVNDSQYIWTLVGFQGTFDNSDYRKPQPEVISVHYQLELGPIWDFLPGAGNRSELSPYCCQLIALGAVKLLKESVSRALTLPVVIPPGIKFEPELDSNNVRIVVACEGGLYLLNGYCVPCGQDMYSKDGSTSCLPCPPGYYQDKIASKNCKRCPHFLRRGCFDLTNKYLILLVLVAVIVVILLIASIIRMSPYLKNRLRLSVVNACICNPPEDASDEDGEKSDDNKDEINSSITKEGDKKDSTDKKDCNASVKRSKSRYDEHTSLQKGRAPRESGGTLVFRNAVPTSQLSSDFPEDDIPFLNCTSEDQDSKRNIKWNFTKAHERETRPTDLQILKKLNDDAMKHDLLRNKVSSFAESR